MNAEGEVARLLREASGRIEAAEAVRLLCHSLGRSQAWLYAHGDATVGPEHAAGFRALVERRASGVPVAYLLGQQGFWSLDLAVTPDTLIPRPETELLVELALERLSGQAVLAVADLGTGSGAIALALAAERPSIRMVATDRSAAALAVARSNAVANGLDARVEFRQGDWFVPLAGERFHLLVSNPPYIAAGDPHLQRGDLRYEPPGALASGDDGLDAIRSLVSGAPGHLHPGGWLLLEHGHDQGPAVRALLEAQGFDQVTTVRDLEQRDRVGLGRLQGS